MLRLLRGLAGVTEISPTGSGSVSSEQPMGDHFLQIQPTAEV